ncbi:hypothetical protein B0H13DRAFT_2276515 [Mycena leptocephala]|nr:hypothetical protein B0H13DRAFT_2276515 [Mycena leptocephala]
MAITRGTSARTASPTPSENSDMYYEDSNNRYASLSPVPSQTADVIGWDSDATPAPGELNDDTPTPQLARASSPASVVEISPDEFPPLPAPTPATITKARTKASKASKGKGKGKAAPVAAEAPTNDDDDPFLAAATAQAVAASLGLPTPMDHATAGASSSRRPAAGAGSPSKPPHKLKIMRKLRGNTANITRNLWGVYMRKSGTARDTMGYHGSFLPLLPGSRHCPVCSAPLPAIKFHQKDRNKSNTSKHPLSTCPRDQ